MHGKKRYQRMRRFEKTYASLSLKKKLENKILYWVHKYVMQF